MRKEARPSKGDTGEIIGDSGQEGNGRKRGGAGRIVFREKIRDLAPDLPYGVLKEKTLDDNLVDPRAGGGTGGDQPSIRKLVETPKVIGGRIPVNVDEHTISEVRPNKLSRVPGGGRQREGT